MIKKSEDGKVKFYEKSHTYKLGKEKLTSVTTVIHKHFPPFDEKGLAKKLAGFWANKQKKRGVRYWLAEWKKNREQGTLCHAEVEKFIEDDDEVLFPVYNPRSVAACKWVKEYLGDYSDWEKIPEMLVYDEEYGVAGQVDLVIRKNNKINILDWKFTKRITKKAYTKGETGTSELTKDLENCNYNTYNLQLSIYAYLLELQGHSIGELVLVHIGPEGKVKPYKVEYLRGKAKELLESVNKK